MSDLDCIMIVDAALLALILCIASFRMWKKR